MAHLWEININKTDLDGKSIYMSERVSEHPTFSKAYKHLEEIAPAFGFEKWQQLHPGKADSRNVYFGRNCDEGFEVTARIEQIY